MKKYLVSAGLCTALFFTCGSPALAQNEDAIEDQGRPPTEHEELPPNLALPADPGSETATIDAALTGDYYLRDMMETGSGLRLKPDGRFEWFFVVGSLDIFAQGRWSANDGAILLVNDPAKHANQAYHFVRSSSWAEATDEEKRIGQGIAEPVCSFGDTIFAPPAAKSLDREVIIQIAFDPTSLPLRGGTSRTKPYPFYDCSYVTVIGANAREERATNHGGYIAATLNKGDTASALIINNQQYSGANIKELRVDFPPLKPGVHQLWLDYSRFEPRMFERLLLERHTDGLRPYFGGRYNGGVYIKSVPKEESEANVPAEDRAQ